MVEQNAQRNDRLLAEARYSLDERSIAIATGIGIFGVVIDNSGNPLLRRRQEKESLYQQDLSGKWEMTGGGVEVSDFPNPEESLPLEDRYQGAIFTALQRELWEEVGLRLEKLPEPLLLIPAWLYRSYEFEDPETNEKEDRITIDTAFVVPIPFTSEYVMETDKFDQLKKNGEVMLVLRDDLDKIEFVSPRTKFMVKQAVSMNVLRYLL